MNVFAMALLSKILFFPTQHLFLSVRNVVLSNDFAIKFLSVDDSIHLWT
jgi:hypothetical protein